MPTEPTAPSTDPGRKPAGEPLALVMGGGGARAAYQVGFLRALAGRFPDLEVPILTGVSAGAINAVHLAAHQGSFPEAVEDLATLWRGLTMDQVFRVDAQSLAMNAARWATQLVSGGLLGRPRIQSLVDTSPLREFLSTALGSYRSPIPGIRENIEAGRLRAVAISTSSYTTGGSVTWIQGRDLEGWSRPRRMAVISELTVDHIMASTALPLFFPAVQIEDEWYGDGGIRLSAPLSPAVHLGAQRLLALSTRFEPTSREASVPVTSGYPPPAQVIGGMLNAVFLDLMDQDALRVERINNLLRKIPPEERGGLRIVRLFTLRPSVDLGRLSQEFEIRLPTVFRFLVRGLGTRETQSPDLLSFLLFHPEYIDRLIRMGEADTWARMGEIEAVLQPPSSPALDAERVGNGGVGGIEAGPPAGPRPVDPADP